MRVHLVSFLVVPFLPACLFGAPTPELRGVWVHGPQIKTPAAADALIARIDRANLNAAFVLVWYWGGQAYFQSNLCPMAEGVQPGQALDGQPGGWPVRPALTGRRGGTA